VYLADSAKYEDDSNK